MDTGWPYFLGSIFQTAADGLTGVASVISQFTGPVRKRRFSSVASSQASI